MHVRRLMKLHAFATSNIVAMDETPVWMDMVATSTVAKTGAKDIPLKTTGHEKTRVSVCLTMKADGTKMKPFIVFIGAKREAKALDEEFKRHCRVASTANGWMNEELTLRYIEEILGRFAFGRRLLVWDSYECHITDSVNTKLREMKFERAIVPGKCTKYIQAADVYVNKPFKERMMERYDEWLANGVHGFTEGGNMKPVPRRMVVEWIVDTWKEIKRDLVVDSFKGCAITTKWDGSEDEKISCFKEGKPCHSGGQLLKSQMELFGDPSETVDPFQLSESDTEEVNGADFIEEYDEDEEIDIEL